MTCSHGVLYYARVRHAYSVRHVCVVEYAMLVLQSNQVALIPSLLSSLHCFQNSKVQSEKSTQMSSNAIEIVPTEAPRRRLSMSKRSSIKPEQRPIYIAIPKRERERERGSSQGYRLLLSIER